MHHLSSHYHNIENVQINYLFFQLAQQLLQHKATIHMHNDLIMENRRISSWIRSLCEGTEYDPVVFGPVK